MTAFEITKFNTGLEDDALVRTLVKQAEARVRQYLGYREDEDVTWAAASTADIATVLYQRLKATQTNISTLTEGSTPVKAESFSEGGVSVSYTYEGGTELIQSFDEQIASILEALKPYQKGRVRFL